MGHLINGGLLCFSADHDLSPFIPLSSLHQTHSLLRSINQSIYRDKSFNSSPLWMIFGVSPTTPPPLTLLSYAESSDKHHFPSFFFCVPAASFREIIITVGSPIRDWFEGFPLSLSRVTQRISPGPWIRPSPSVVVVSTVPYHHSMCIDQCMFVSNSTPLRLTLALPCLSTLSESRFVLEFPSLVLLLAQQQQHQRYTHCFSVQRLLHCITISHIPLHTIIAIYLDEATSRVVEKASGRQVFCICFWKCVYCKIILVDIWCCCCCFCLVYFDWFGFSQHFKTFFLLSSGFLFLQNNAIILLSSSLAVGLVVHLFTSFAIFCRFPFFISLSWSFLT